MNRYDDDPVWDALFAKSQHVLEAMADEALSDHLAGRTQPMDVFFARQDFVDARSGIIEHAGQRYALTWDVCPWCGGEART